MQRPYVGYTTAYIYHMLEVENKYGRRARVKVNVKGEVHPRTSHEGPGGGGADV